MTPTLVQRDERTIAFENAGYRWSYLFLSFGLLALVAYRPSEVALGRPDQAAQHPLAPVINELKRYRGDIALDLEQFSPAADYGGADVASPGGQ